MKTRAAVCRDFGSPLEIAELDIDAPGPEEVLVSLRASGVCQTDTSIRSGALPVTLPIVLGHEGAGVVEAVGPGVTRVKPGDHVVLSWVPQCGRCYYCSRGQAHLCEPGTAASSTHFPAPNVARLHDDGHDVRQLSGLGTFSTALIAHHDAVVPIGDAVSFDVAAVIGCAVLTGFGAAVNTANIRRGDSVVVIGCGGIGLNSVQGAVIAGAERVIAVDRSEAALARAKRFGATDTVLAGDTAREAIGAMTAGRGADVVLDVVASAHTFADGLSMTRRGGELVVVGMPRFTDTWTVAPMPNFIGAERRILGCRYGSCSVHRDVPSILGHYERGQLLLDELITSTVPLTEVNAVMDGLPTAGGSRTMLTLES